MQGEGVKGLNLKVLKNIILRILRWLYLSFFVLISIGPLIWIIISSFKSNKEILSSAFALPSSISAVGYKAAIELSPIFQYYGNSIIIAIVSTLLNIIVVSMAAYILARVEFRGKTFLTLL